MKFLFINQHASAPAFGVPYRNYYLANELVKDGHEVMIITSSYSHLRKKNPSKDECRDGVVFSDIAYSFVATPSYTSKKLSRAWNLINFLLRLTFKKSSIDAFNPDVIVDCTPGSFTGLWSLYFSKKQKAKFVIEIRDLWPAAPVEISGIEPKNILIKIYLRYLKMLITASDVLISTIRYAPEYYKQHNIYPNRFLHLQNAYPISDQSEGGSFSLRSQMDELRKKYHTLICYPGSINAANGIMNLPKILNYYHAEGVGFIIIGKGSLLEQLKAECENIASKNVHFFDPIPKSEISQLLKYVDFGFVGGRNWNFLKYGISQNKLFDFMGAGTPIICFARTDDKFLEELGCGLYVDPDSPKEIQKFFEELDKARIAREELGMAGKKAIKEYYNYTALKDRFLSVFKEY